MIIKDRTHSITDVETNDSSPLPNRCFLLLPLLSFPETSLLPHTLPLLSLLRQRFHRLKPPHPHAPPSRRRLISQRRSCITRPLLLRLILPQIPPRSLQSISNVPSSPLTITTKSIIIKAHHHFLSGARTPRRQPLRRRSHAYVPRLRQVRRRLRPRGVRELRTSRRFLGPKRLRRRRGREVRRDIQRGYSEERVRGGSCRRGDIY